MGGVFISYRREDSQGSTGRIADRLHELLGDDVPLFLDIDSIRPGQDFREVISQTLAQCDVTLVMIGPRWLEVTDEDGNNRLAADGDLHRLEVESALASSAITIPVLVEGASMPAPGDLPESIRELAFLHAAEVSVRRFGSDAGYLADLVRSVAAAEPAPPAEPVRPVVESVTPAAPVPPVVEPDPQAGSVPPVESLRAGPDRRAVLAGSLVALVAIIGVVVALTRDDTDPSSAPQTSVTDAPLDVPESAGIDVFSLQVGDCFGPVDDFPVTSVEPLDCAGLHSNEVYAIWDSFTATLPDDQELLDGCVARFDDAVGIPYRFSSYFVGGFWPDEDRWREGDRTVICYGFVRDGQGAAIATTGSMLGSGN